MLHADHLGAVVVPAFRIPDRQNVIQIDLIQITVLSILLSITQADEFDGHGNLRNIHLVLCKPLLRGLQKLRLDILIRYAILANLEIRFIDLTHRLSIIIDVGAIDVFEPIVVHPDDITLCRLAIGRDPGGNPVQVLLPVDAQQILSAFDQIPTIITDIFQAEEHTVITDEAEPKLGTDAIIRIKKSLHDILPLIVEILTRQRVRAVACDIKPAAEHRICENVSAYGSGGIIRVRRRFPQGEIFQIPIEYMPG